MADSRYAAEEPRHPIQVVARRTGLTADVIRAWERRHQAVAPERSRTSRRLYSDADVDRLLLLRRATLLGRRIGDVAHLPTAELTALVDADESAAARIPHSSKEPTDDPLAQTYFASALDALRSLDCALLERVLHGAGLTLGAPVLIDHVLAPLMRTVGDLWREGSIGISHEHLASETVRSLLSSLRIAYTTPSAGPEIVVTTPVAESHELGALMAAVTAGASGWRVSYLGPSLPAEEVASTALARRARAVALSVIRRGEESRLHEEIRRLRRLLPHETVLFVGGPGLDALEGVLRDAGAIRVPSMKSFAVELDRLR